MNGSINRLSSGRETVAEKVKRLQAEARKLARDHVHQLTQGLSALQVLAAEIAEGGDAYPPGVRDIARRLAEECEGRAQNIEVILTRQA